MRNIMFLVETLSNGGAERAVSNISLNIDQTINGKIVMFGKNSRLVYPYLGDIVYLDRLKTNNFTQKIFALIHRLKKIRELKINNPHAVTISFLEYPNLINALTANNGKTILSVRNHMSTKHKFGIKSKLWFLIIKHVYRKANLIISVSKEIKRDLIKNYRIDERKIKVIYNSYDIDGIKIMAKESLESDYKDIFSNPVIITAGRQNKQKGQWHLIRAFSKVKKKIQNAHLVILGKGELEQYLRELVAGLGLQKDVHFFGFKKNPFKYIARSKVFIMSSFYEGFPNALAEAMACGVPVISTDCLSGPREIIAPYELNKEMINYSINTKHYGILTPVCTGIKYSVKDKLEEGEIIMANRIITILQDEVMNEHFSNQSLRRIADFNIKHIISQWEELALRC